ncbi:LysR family transcriptional regulator [Pseudonocardiaceae bacterium YIM PH 21723]|nr:LysR family transcriptional regulator [Pseudonocardiaceae bacterium YIM PH 21723]
MRDFDLNLVRTFVLLYETRSVTATAESMHVTQPTISYSLQKLRRRFGDELFRRGGGGLEPTTTARELYQPLHHALAGIETAVSGAHSFDPATAQSRFTLCLSDLGETSLLPRLLAELPAHAPGVTLSVRPLDLVNAEDMLSRGEIDAFIASRVIGTGRIARLRLFDEGYMGMVGASHPRLTGDRVSLKELAREQHVAVVSQTGHNGPRQALEAHGLLHRIVVEVPRFSALPYLVQHSELMAMVPRNVARVFAADHPVRLLELPLDIEPAQVAIYARHSHGRSPAQQWLIGFMRDLLAVP